MLKLTFLSISKKELRYLNGKYLRKLVNPYLLVYNVTVKYTILSIFYTAYIALLHVSQHIWVSVIDPISNPLRIKCFASGISISFKCKCNIIMQIKYTKNLYSPGDLKWVQH